jgi:hypothetical protein
MTALRAAVAAATLLGVLTGCTSGTDTDSSTAPPAGVRDDTAPAGPTVPQVVRPWQAGMPQLGVNLYWENSVNDDDEVTRAKARRALDHLITLNVNSVAVNFPFVMKNARSSAVGPHADKTPSADRVEIFLEEAAASRMRVTLRPLLDERSLLPAWRGRISPAGRDAWFASYTTFLKAYAAAAQRHHVAEFVVGVELNSMQRDRRWGPLVKALRKTFTGELAYSMNFDEFQRGSRAPDVDTVGVDAYFKVRKPDSTSVAVLTSAWVDWLDRHAGDKASDLVLHEVGIAAQSGAFHNPAQWGDSDLPLNLTVQKHWYQAVCAAVKKKRLAGLYFWNLNMHAEPGAEDPEQSDRLTFVDRPAETVIKTCYAALGAEQ